MDYVAVSYPILNTIYLEHYAFRNALIHRFLHLGF